VTQPTPQLDGEGPYLFAHRGTSTLAPENSSAAFDLALQYRADVLEIDVRISRDQHIIVTHDASVVRTTNGDGKIADQTLSELKALDAGYRFTDSHGNQPWRGRGLTLLTLQELFQQYPKVGINIDIKDNSQHAAKLLADHLLPLVDGRWINVGSFHTAVIQRFRQLAPYISTAASQWDVARLYFARVLPSHFHRRAVASVNCNVLQIPQQWKGLSLDTAAFIKTIQDNRCSVMYWTINDAANMRGLLDRGANGLVSDEIGVARQVIDHYRSNR